MHPPIVDDEELEEGYQGLRVRVEVVLIVVGQPGKRCLLWIHTSTKSTESSEPHVVRTISMRRYRVFGAVSS